MANDATNPAAGVLDPAEPTNPNPQDPTNPAPAPKDPAQPTKVPDGYIALPTDTSTPEELAVFYSKLGRPESADKYGVSLDNDESGETAKAFAEAAFKAGLSKSQAEAVAKASNAFVAQKMQTYRAEQDKQMKELQSAWGADYQKNAELARQAARQFGLGKEQLVRLESAMGSKALMEFMHKIGSAIADPNLKGVGNGATPSSAKAYTPQEAAAKMKELQADKAFGAKFMANDPEALKLFEELSNAMAGGN